MSDHLRIYHKGEVKVIEFVDLESLPVELLNSAQSSSTQLLSKYIKQLEADPTQRNSHLVGWASRWVEAINAALAAAPIKHLQQQLSTALQRIDQLEATNTSLVEALDTAQAQSLLLVDAVDELNARITGLNARLEEHCLVASALAISHP